jgi:hypothetical protein
MRYIIRISSPCLAMETVAAPSAAIQRVAFSRPLARAVRLGQPTNTVVAGCVLGVLAARLQKHDRLTAVAAVAA